jgi:hypothetical protein
MNPDYNSRTLSAIEFFESFDNSEHGKRIQTLTNQLISDSLNKERNERGGRNTGLFEDVSVIEASPIGQNLHQLLEEKQHPLTDTALEYIRELEEKLSTNNTYIKNLEQALQQADKDRGSLRKDNGQLRARANHPARR